MDSLHPIDVSESKWDSLFQFLLNNSETVYFYGLRVLVTNEELFNTIGFAAERILINENYNRIFFRLKTANVLLNRSLIRTLWLFFETASLVFLIDRDCEDILLKSSSRNILIKDNITQIDGCFFVYQGVESNVLWVESDQDFSNVVSNLKR